MSPRDSRALVASFTLLISACDPVPVPDPERFPPSQPKTAATMGAPPSQDLPRQAPSATAAATPTPSATPSAPAPEAPGPPDASGEPRVVDADGKVLPQTKDEPKADDSVFLRHTKMLWEAIVKNDPEIARTFFFPVQAYEQVKAIKEPAKDWKYRLWKNFERDVKQYHQQLGKRRDEAKLLRVDIRRKPEWMEVGREGNLIGYYRVTRSLIYFEDHEGRERQLDLTSMISWRGHWYVVHLHGFE